MIYLHDFIFLILMPSPALLKEKIATLLHVANKVYGIIVSLQHNLKIEYALDFIANIF